MKHTFINQDCNKLIQKMALKDQDQDQLEKIISPEDQDQDQQEKIPCSDLDHTKDQDR